MKENDLLEWVLDTAGERGYEAAYQLLLSRRQDLEDSPTLYYYLSCLACGAGRAGEGRLWLGEAILGRGFWYRPEALEDEDLAPLFGENLFADLTGLSRLRWAHAGRLGRPLFTWRRRQGEKLLVALHGNGQNAAHALADWREMNVQVEALQSPTVDCRGRFRWQGSEAEMAGLRGAAAEVARAGYQRVYWAGFSAGCEALMQGALGGLAPCDGLLLQSPWLPGLKRERQALGREMAARAIPISIFCGEEDEDCRQMACLLAQTVEEAGGRARLILQPGLRHQFPPRLGSEYQLALS